MTIFIVLSLTVIDRNALTDLKIEDQLAFSMANYYGKSYHIQ